MMILGLIGVLVIGSITTLVVVSRTKKQAPTAKKWNLVWSDEFAGSNGTAVDANKWVHDIGGEGWGNNEEQYYTDGTNNCYQQDGNLVIEAKKEKNGNNNYTSARITTKGKFEFKYGKVEMRARIPYGQGIWPAFWMLGANFDTAGWPDCGEIDIMENVGKEPKIIHGTLHGPGYSGNMGIGNMFISEKEMKDDFHVFSVEWSENKIDWFVDGVKYHTMDSTKVMGNKWVYNDKFFLLLNLAVGGNWPGYPDVNTTFPQKYYIDYVRVYQ